MVLDIKQEALSSKSKWYFPSGRNLEKTSASNAYVETFNDKKIESLAREICQNSLDAADGSNNPVKVTFEMIQIDTRTIPGYSDLVSDIIPRAERTWPNEEKTKRLISKMKSVLNSDEVSVLKISDENTTGLEPQNWASLIEQAGSSVKSNDESGGSFGIGKAAPFAVSDLRMVFYNTLSVSESEQSIGVSKFVSYDLDNGETTQGTGYYGEDEKIPFNHGVNFDPTSRNHKGTDVYIIGFAVDDFPDWKSGIIYSILDNFLVSIEYEQLEVMVEDKVISKNSIQQYVDMIRADKKLSKQYIDLLSYYDVLADTEHIVVEFPGFEGYKIKDGEAILLLSNKTENNRKVLMTRKAGMKIFDKNRISGILKFSGVFQATGAHINKILKELENPNHDKWSVDRAQNKRQAKWFLNHVTRFIKDAVVEHFQEKITEQVDAFGVSDFLPSNLESIKGERAEKQPLVSEKASVRLKKLNLEELHKTPIRSNEIGELSNEELIKSGIIEGNTAGVAFGGGGGGGLRLGDNDFGGGTEPGNYGNDFDGDDNLVIERIDRKRIANMKYRVIEQDSLAGKYKLLLNPEKNIRDVKVTVSIIGDSGNKSKVRVLQAMNANIGSLKSRRDAIFLPNLIRNKWQSIDVTLNQQNRLKLEVEVDANFE